MSINMQAVVWMVLLVVLLATEAMTLGLTTIWFAVGSFVAFILALSGADLLTQIIVFCIVALVLLIFTRPVAVRWLNRGRTQTNAGSLIGATAVVTETIDNLAGEGQVQVRGQHWTARTEEDSRKIPVGRTVKIEKISGVKLIVKEE